MPATGIPIPKAIASLPGELDPAAAQLRLRLRPRRAPPPGYARGGRPARLRRTSRSGTVKSKAGDCCAPIFASGTALGGSLGTWADQQRGSGHRRDPEDSVLAERRLEGLQGDVADARPAARRAARFPPTLPAARWPRACACIPGRSGRRSASRRRRRARSPTTNSAGSRKRRDLNTCSLSRFRQAPGRPCSRSPTR